MLSLFYCSVCLSLVCYNVMFFVFFCVRTIQTGKTDSISQKYQIMVISILNNWSRRYSSYYGFIPIYYTINLDIVSFFMVFSHLYLGSIDLL